MSLAIKYEEVGDAKMRLRGCVVLYKGAPVLVSDVLAGNGDDIFRVLFNELPIVGARVKRADPEEGEGVKRKFISSKHFDIAPFKMGYVNSQGPGGAFYCQRMPNRVQKQGLCAENFTAVNNYGQGIPFGAFTTSKEVPAMIANDYPSFDQAVRSLDKLSAVAFHREFCLVKDAVIQGLIYLYHKAKKVGMYTKNNGEIGLGKQFACLKETLQEQRIKVGVC